jgi:hypothetical protein
MVKGSARDPEGAGYGVECRGGGRQGGAGWAPLPPARFDSLVLAALAVWLITNYVLSPAAMLGGRW